MLFSCTHRSFSFYLWVFFFCVLSCCFFDVFDVFLFFAFWRPTNNERDTSRGSGRGGRGPEGVWPSFGEEEVFPETPFFTWRCPSFLPTSEREVCRIQHLLFFLAQVHKGGAGFDLHSCVAWVATGNGFSRTICKRQWPILWGPRPPSAIWPQKGKRSSLAAAPSKAHSPPSSDATKSKNSSVPGARPRSCNLFQSQRRTAEFQAVTESSCGAREEPRALAWRKHKPECLASKRQGIAFGSGTIEERAEPMDGEAKQFSGHGGSCRGFSVHPDGKFDRQSRHEAPLCRARVMRQHVECAKWCRSVHSRF